MKCLYAQSDHKIPWLEALYISGHYPLFYLFMQVGKQGGDFFLHSGHMTVLIVLVVQTFLIARFGGSLRVAFGATLLVPIVYTLVSLPKGLAWFLDAGHLFFWVYALAAALLWVAIHRFGGVLGPLVSRFGAVFLNISALVFVYFVFELKLNAEFYQPFSAFPVTHDLLHIGFLWHGFELFTQQPHHRYLINAALFLGLLIAAAQCQATLSAHRLDRLNSQLHQRIEEGVKRQVEQERLLVQQSKMASLGEMMGVIAHQWKQPLSSASLLVQMCLREIVRARLNKQQIVADLQAIKGQLEHMDQTAHDFQSFLRPSDKKQNFDLLEATRSALRLAEPMLQSAYLAFRVDLPQDPIRVEGYPNEFGQVVLSLICNAKEAVLAKRGAQEGRIALTLSQDEGWVTMYCMDNGGGIDPQVLPKIFDHHFTTKLTGNGIGLHMARTIIQTHMNGTLAAINKEEGACLIIRLPLAQKGEA